MDNLKPGVTGKDIEEAFGGKEPEEYYLEIWDRQGMAWDHLRTYQGENFKELESDFDVLMKFFKVRMVACDSNWKKRVEWQAQPDSEKP